MFMVRCSVWFWEFGPFRSDTNRIDSILISNKYHKNQYFNSECRMSAFYTKKIKFLFNGKCDCRINLLIGWQHLRTMQRMLIDRKMDSVDSIESMSVSVKWIAEIRHD